MRKLLTAQAVAACLAVLGFCCPQVGLAESSVPNQPPVISDVTLQEGGVFLGRVVDAQNRGIQGTSVTLSADNQRPLTTKTDAEGVFTFRQLRGGVYQLAAGGNYHLYRLWAPGTAPTAAQGQSTVGTEEIVRGQSRFFRPGLFGALRDPGVLAAATAVAVSVPVSICVANDNKKTPVSP